MPGPDLASRFVGRIFVPDANADVRYRIERPLGEGGMGIALRASREHAGASTPAVIKVVRPEVLATDGTTARLMVQKEAVALGRLNERVPPTPFVVRLLDTGTTTLEGGAPVVLPWLAIEFVDGGPEGTTLAERVEYSVRHTRFAFDPARAARLVEGIAAGLDAIHDVGVVHRDLTPGNVLLCGFGADEVPKIADFGIARPKGVNATFGGVFLGTPGYGAPEQSFSDEGEVGPWTDVFSFGCLVYLALTGEGYFDVSNFARALMLAREPARRSIADAPALSPELRDDVVAVKTIDGILAHATAANPAMRPARAGLLAASLLAALDRGAPRSRRASQALLRSLATGDRETSATWASTVHPPPRGSMLVRAVAWDGNGQCLALTTAGMRFWTGTAWLPMRTTGLPPTATIRTVSAVRPGVYLLAGDRGLVAITEGRGAPRLLAAPAEVDFTLAGGDPDDLAAVVGVDGSGAPRVFTIAAGRFFRPVVLEGAAAVAGLARVDDTRWLLVGRSARGTGFAMLYSALELALTELACPSSEAITAAAGHVEPGVAVAAGRGGATVLVDGARGRPEVVDGAPDLSAAAVDVQGNRWVAGVGRLFRKDAADGAPFRAVFGDPALRAPFVSLRAEPGVVTGITVDGGVVEIRTR